MKTIAKRPTRLSNTGLCILALALLVLAGLAIQSPIGTTQAQQSDVAAEATRVGSLKEETKTVGKDGHELFESQPNLAPDLITVTTYPFTNTSAIALEDMSSGTTQLVGPGTDDTNSGLVNIGFDYWYDGVRFTQFGVNGNGFARLGTAPTGSSFTNSIATTTNAPKIMAFWDDLCVGSNGKVHFKTIGSAPNRKLIVEFQNMQITRGAGCAGTGGGTFQIWLFETTGVIEYVYGSGMVATAVVDGGYSIGLQSGGATNFASVTTTGPTVSYAAANNAQTNAITAGTAYLFTPQTATAPSGLNFTGTTAVATTLNWTDNSSNEFGFVVSRSTDGINFSFLSQTAAGATSFPDSGLSPGTQYFYEVRAVTEGALSAAAANNVTTSAAGNISSTGAGGNWSANATWVGGVVPTSTDNVTIVDGATVTIDTAASAFSLTVGTGGAASVLRYEDVTPRTLTVGGSVSVATNGTLQSAATGTVTTHVLSVGGNLTNNGVVDFSTNANTAGANLTFTNAPNATYSGTGATNDMRAITVNKGASSASVVELTATNFTVQGVGTDVAGFLTLTNGTFKISGTFTMTNRIFASATYTIAASTGLWMNNPNFTVPGQAGGTTCANNGLFRMTQGTYGIGVTGADGMGGGAGATFIIEGGTINATRFDPQSAVSFTMSGGTMNISPTTGNTRSNFGSFELFSTTATFNMSGGVINLIQAAVAATPIDYQVLATSTITGGTLNVGTAATITNFNFRIRGNVPAMVVDNTTNNKTATLTAQTNTFGNVTVNTGAAINTGSFIWLVIGPSIINNGTITVPTSGSRFYFLGNGPQTYAGSGTCTIVTGAGSVDLTMDNPAGLTIDPSSNGIITQRVNFFRGNITNANKLTLGNGGATVGVLQYGLTGGLNTAGNFDVAPVFNIGTGGQTILWAQEPTPRTTSVEIPASRTITNATVNNTNGVVIAGGNLTLAPTIATSTLTFTTGTITTNANTLILNSASTVARTLGHVIGNFRKTYLAAGSKIFEVGTANGFSPVTVNATAGTFPSDFTVSATQGPHPAVNPATSVQRYWTLTEGGDITADLTFQYLAADVLGTEANYKVIRSIGGISVAFPLSTVNTGAHTASLTGVSNFSDWTVGEISAPTAAPATISGQVTTTSGAPLAGVTIWLSGARSALAITDAGGNYRFANMETGGFYTVTPGIVNYHFSPASRSFSLLGNTTDAVFAGTRDAASNINVIDTPEYFVRQHYLDFLGREPDSAGLSFWSNQIRSCGNDFNCIERRTINVSAAYFLSIEFRKTGGLVDGLYRASYGRAPHFDEFMPDAARVGRDVIVGDPDWEAQLATNMQEFLDAWVDRAAFHAAYDNLPNDGYVEALISNTGVTFTDSERATLVGGLNGGTLTRAQVLAQVAQDERFVRAKFNEAFVRMQYFGYLRREPDDAGFHFWLNKLNEFEGNFERAEMVKAFIVSGEYRDRFRQ